MWIRHLAEPSASAGNTPQTSLKGRAARALPGIIAGAADLDPAAVLTATVAGASFGHSLGWGVLLSVFAVSSRIGHESSSGREELAREDSASESALLIALLIVAVNSATIVSD